MSHATGLKYLKDGVLPHMKEDNFAVGKLADRDEPDFNTRYEEIRASAMAQKGWGWRKAK